MKSRFLRTLLLSILCFVPFFATAQAVPDGRDARAQTQLHPKRDIRLTTISRGMDGSDTRRVNGMVSRRVRVFLTAVADEALLSRLRAAGLTITSHGGRQAEGFIAASHLSALETMPEVNFLQAPRRARPQAGSVSNGGIAFMNVAPLQAMGLQGAGVRVGVISDGVTGLSAAKATGDLPSVTVVNDDCKPSAPGECAEGTAMLEIVHDLAPSATLGFCGAWTALSVGDCLDRLVDQFHADIVVDDLSAFDEPMFEDGPVALNINRRAQAGVLYATSAGNQFGCSYEADFRPELTGGVSYDAAHDFGLAAGTGSLDRNSMVVPPGGFVDVAMQWNDPYETAANDYDLYLLDEGGNILAQSTNIQDGKTAPAFEEVGYANNGASDQTVQLMVMRAKGASTRHLRLMFSDGGSGCGGITSIAYTTPGIGGIFGHAAADGALTVAALDGLDGLTRETFSAIGPVRIDYPSFTLRAKPDISAIDNVAVSGAGGFGGPGTCGGATCFSGTSAAAPQVAGILALLKGSFTGSYRQSILFSATALGDHNLFGSGRIDALAAAKMLNRAPTAAILSPSADVVITEGGQVTFDGSCTDPENIPGTAAQWSFGAGSGVASSTLLKPGAVSFPTTGTFTVQLTCTDALGRTGVAAKRTVTVTTAAPTGGGGGGGGGGLGLWSLLVLAFAVMLRRQVA